jgi:cytochrome c2
MSWPLNDRQGYHDSYNEPVFSWIPSIAVSNLIRLEGELFGNWKGDLIVASLRTESLYRVRVKGGRALFVEPVPLGHRIRDLAEDEDGRIVLFFDYGDIGLFDVINDDQEPESLFLASCAGCHPLKNLAVAGGNPGMGPSLYNISGRRIATRSYRYSPSLKRMSDIWSDQNLDAFLSDPQGFAPGTRMRFKIADPEKRAAIIGYLRELD